MVNLLAALLLEFLLHLADTSKHAHIAYPRACNQQHREYLQRFPGLPREVEVLKCQHSQVLLAGLFHLLVQGEYALAQEHLVVLVAVEAPEVVVSEILQRDFIGVRLDDVLKPARPLRLELGGVHQHVQVHHEKMSPQARRLADVAQNVRGYLHLSAKFRLF